MDGVWLPAGEENPGARGLPDSRPTPGPGIAKGEAFSPLARRRSPEVNKIASACQAEPDPADSEIRNPDSTAKNITGHAVNVGLRPTQPQPNRRPIATAQGPAPSVGQDVGPRADREANRPPLGPPFQPLIVTGDRSPSGDLAFAAG